METTVGMLFADCLATLINVARAKSPDEETMERCECYNTMGQIRHVCVFCQARSSLDKFDSKWRERYDGTKVVQVPPPAKKGKK